MIGQMNAAEFTTREKHLATITAATDGMIAIMPFGELKMEVRKSPQEVSTLLSPLSSERKTNGNCLSGFQNNASCDPKRHGNHLLQRARRRAKLSRSPHRQWVDVQEAEGLLLQKCADAGLPRGHRET